MASYVKAAENVGSEIVNIISNAENSFYEQIVPDIGLFNHSNTIFDIDLDSEHAPWTTRKNRETRKRLYSVKRAKPILKASILSINKHCFNKI